MAFEITRRITSYVHINVYLRVVAMEDNMENDNHDFQQLTTADLIDA
jgi:hypothetical protein